MLGKSNATNEGGARPQIYVTAPTGSTVTCDGIEGTEVSGTWTFEVAFGTHTIIGSKDGQSKTKTVLVEEVKRYNVTIAYILWLYNEGDNCIENSGGWVIRKIVSGSNGTITDYSDYKKILFCKCLYLCCK